MISEWFQRVGSSVPRGFSRYFILELLKTKSHSGKEIIDYAVEQSNGIWKPSPGLIYPLLGRLLDEGLIEEDSDGKYQLTKKVQLKLQYFLRKFPSPFLTQIRNNSQRNGILRILNVIFHRENWDQFERWSPKIHCLKNTFVETHNRIISLCQ